MLRAVQDLFYVYLSCRKVVTDPVWAHRRPALFFHSLRHFLSSRVQSKGFYLALCKCCQLILSGPAPRFPSLGSLPLVFSTLCSLPACPHACAALVFRSITLSVLRWPWVAVAAMAHQTLPRAVRWPSPCPPPVEAHLLCLAACANVGQGDRLSNPQLSTELESRFLEFFHLRISLSGVYLFCLLPTNEAS